MRKIVVVRCLGCFHFWGVQLKVMEKFNSSIFNYKLSNGKTFSCSYFLSSDNLLMPSLIDFYKKQLS